MKIVVFPLSITSSWGNGHATNYRGLARALLGRGHRLLVLERDKPWYACTRDFAATYVRLYDSVGELERWRAEVQHADLVIVGSYVPDGCDVCDWVLSVTEGVTAFWDIDTPVTAAKMTHGDYEYVSPALAGRFDLYLSFTGGALLDELGARRPRPFYCAVDPLVYTPVDAPTQWDLGYLGTYSEDRQRKIDELLLEPARAQPKRAFAVAGPQYPEEIEWPSNVQRLDNLAPAEHRGFYCAQSLTLNVTRDDMVRAGWSPSVRLFEAAACGVPVVSDWWDGLDAFFEPEREILVAHDRDDIARHLSLGDRERREIGARARERVLREHTADHRAVELERHVADVMRSAA